MAVQQLEISRRTLSALNRASWTRKTPAISTGASHHFRRADYENRPRGLIGISPRKQKAAHH